jgi:pilus assembly protein Flp/PilA
MARRSTGRRLTGSFGVGPDSRGPSSVWTAEPEIRTMKNLALKVQRFLVSEDGPTAVEYAVMLALIVIVCLTAIQAIGTNANVTFNSVASKLGSTGSS